MQDQVHDEVVLHPVESSNIKAVGYRVETKQLLVQFKADTLYSYDGVEADTFEALLNAESVGKYFNANIKDRYTTTKVM